MHGKLPDCFALCCRLQLIPAVPETHCPHLFLQIPFPGVRGSSCLLVLLTCAGDYTRYAHGLIADYLPEDIGKQLATSLGFVTRFVCVFSVSCCDNYSIPYSMICGWHGGTVDRSVELAVKS